MDKLKKITLLTLMCQLDVTASVLPAQAVVRPNKIVADIADMTIIMNYEDYKKDGKDGSPYFADDMLLCEYPIVLHKRIVYIPLTYYNCILLGLNLELKEDEIFLSKSNPEKPTMYLKDQSHPRRDKKTIEMALLPYPLNLCGVKYSDLEYPALFYKNIAYLPLTWKVAHAIMQWDYRFGEKGIELYTDSYYYYSEGDSHFKINKKRDLAASVSPGKTYYKKGDTKIFAFTELYNMIGPSMGNMEIFKGEKKTTIPGYTGHGQKQGPLFTVDCEYIYTAHIEIDRHRYGYCKIKMDTGEITYLGGDNLYYEP